MSSSSTHGGFLKELLVISGLAGTQVVAAVYTVFLKRVLSLGVDPLFIVIVGNFIQGVFVLALAVPFERNKWPARLTPVLMGQFLLIGFGGVTAFQGLLVYGIRNTSPAIASAMPNLTPGLVFLIAACFGFEKFEMGCYYTRAKVLGTLICLSGALSLSFLQNPPSTQNGNRTGKSNYQDWIIGCLCLLSAVVSLSCSMVLQAATMINFQPPFSLCAITSLIGATLTALMQIATNGKLDVGSPAISMTSIIIFVLTGGLTAGLSMSFLTWCVGQKGPLMVSIFCPIQTITSVLLTAIVLRQYISLASFAGMLAMFIGLYIVLWAKKKECSVFVGDGGNAAVPKHDINKHLLS